MATSQTVLIEEKRDDLGARLTTIGAAVLRYGLVIILLWIGGLKFTDYEAQGIMPLVSNSPLLSWTYHVMSVQQLSMALGITEIALGILIALRPVAPKISAIGSMGAIVMALITLTFLLSTPPVWQMDKGFPFLSPMPGQFLLKDLLLLGTALWTAGEAWSAATARLPHST